MIDFLTLQLLSIPPEAAKVIADHNFLQTNSRDGEVCYDNNKTKNLEQNKGVSISIETSRRLRAECSLHKYYNASTKGSRNNFDLFTMPEALKAIDMLLKEKQLPPGMRIYNFEIGLNLNVEKDCEYYLDRIIDIGVNSKQLWNNAKYKDERMKTTEFHKDFRKYFKIYDKVFEANDKKKSVEPPEHPILRIETAFRRVEGFTVENFFTPRNLNRLMTQFFRDWRTLRFERDIVTPKGTGRAKQALCLQIISSSTDKVLLKSKERYAAGALTDWEYRNIKEFIRHEWPSFKKEIRFIQSAEEEEYRRLLQNYNRLLKR